MAGFAGLWSNWADDDPLSRAQGEERGWVSEGGKESGRREAEEAAGR